MGGQAWLFVRAHECVWLQRSPVDTCVLAMNGPSVHRRTYRFETVESLHAFIAATQEQLVSNGWSLQEFEPGQDRRVNGPR